LRQGAFSSTREGRRQMRGDLKNWIARTTSGGGSPRRGKIAWIS
jgi:hypothetical protein